MELREEYIFIRSIPHRDSSCFARAAAWVGNVKLVIFNHNLISPLLMPCLTCYPVTYPTVETGSSLSDIRQLWDAQNTNMNQYLVTVEESVNTTCNFVYRDLWQLILVEFCPVAAISKKYNLTLVTNEKGYTIPETFENRNFGNAILTTILLGDLSYSTCDIKFKPLNFVTVTNLPAPASGVDTFVSPFDLETWACLAVSVVSIAGYLTWHGARQDGGGNSFLITLASKGITVTCILLGQVGDSTGKAFRVGKVALVLLTLWLFGNLLLMANLYQGSIYSCLAVLFPPQTPRGVEDLVNWDIPVVAADHVYSYNTAAFQSYLFDYIIPDLLSAEGHTPKFKQLMSQLRSKILSSHNISVYDTLVEIMGRNSSYPIISVFNNNQYTMDHLMTNTKLAGNRHIVQNSGDTPFRIIEYVLSYRTLLSAYLTKEWGRMRDAGLGDIWKKMFTISRMFGWEMESPRRSEALTILLYNLRDPVTFHEATPVSAELIEPIFAICGAVMGLGMVMFVVENREIVARLGVFVAQEILHGSRYVMTSATIWIRRITRKMAVTILVASSSTKGN